MKVRASVIQPGMCIKGYGRVQSVSTRHTVNPANDVWEGTALVFLTEGGSLMRLPYELVKVVHDDESVFSTH